VLADADGKPAGLADAILRGRSALPLADLCGGGMRLEHCLRRRLGSSGALAMAGKPKFSRVFAQASLRGADDESAEKSEQQVDFRIHFLHLAGRFAAATALAARSIPPGK